MSQTRRIIILTGALLLATIGVARADAGTPLIWAGIFQMFIGNFFIGLGEAFLLTCLYKTSLARAFLGMVLANYASAWIGFYLTIGHYFPQTLDKIFGDSPPPISHMLIPELRLFAALFTITVLIEWPFCYWILRSSIAPRKGIPAINSLKASILAQSASYAVLLPLYLIVRIYCYRQP